MTMQDEVKVREIETVAGDFLTEAGVPFYRVEIDGFCADFDYREAAENFANAINQMVARHRQQAERDALARMEPVGWLYKKQDEEPQVTTIRWRDIVDGRFVFGSGDWTETPLYALPTPPAGEV